MCMMFAKKNGFLGKNLQFYRISANKIVKAVFCRRLQVKACVYPRETGYMVRFDELQKSFFIVISN